MCLARGQVIFTRHFLEELRNDTLTMQDVLTVCRTGVVVDPPEPDIRSGEWKYRIEGRTLDQDLVVVVFCFRAEDGAVFITVFRR